MSARTDNHQARGVACQALKIVFPALPWPHRTLFPISIATILFGYRRIPLFGNRSLFGDRLIEAQGQRGSLSADGRSLSRRKRLVKGFRMLVPRALEDHSLTNGDEESACGALFDSLFN